MKSLFALSFVSMIVFANTVNAGPVLCSSADGEVVISAILEGEGNLLNVRVTEDGDEYEAAELTSLTSYSNKEFSFESMISQPEESLVFSLKTKSVGKSNLMKGTFVVSVSESRRSFPVSCIVVFPTEENVEN